MLKILSDAEKQRSNCLTLIECLQIKTLGCVKPLLVWKERNPYKETGVEYYPRFPNRSDIVNKPEWTWEFIMEMREQVRVLEYELSRKIGAALTNKYVY